jgi:hypothetical protein
MKSRPYEKSKAFFIACFLNCPNSVPFSKKYPQRLPNFRHKNTAWLAAFYLDETDTPVPF